MIADFLLARIADDESIAQAWPPDAQPGVAPNGRQWVDGHGHPIYWPRARVLAECEAKRRMVSLAVVDAPYESEFYRMTWEAAQTLLELLALPYADHPDFNPDWKVP